MIHVAKESEINHLGEDQLTPEHEKRQVLTRVLDSVAFRRSPRLREFLEFICRCALEGREDEISEQRIGEEVFHRGRQFNPAEDNIVRATARSLRIKLRDYFDTEGSAEAFRIEIPKGNYVPQFVTMADPPLAPPQVVAPRSRVATLILAVLVAGLTITSGWLWRENQSLAGRAPAEIAAESLFTAILGPETTLNVVSSDSLHHYLQDLQHALTPVEDYASGRVFAGTSAPAASQISQQLWDLVRAQTLSNGDDLRAILRLARRIPTDSGVKFHHARQLRMSAFQVGEDFLIVGGRRANPWASLFEKDLEFHMEFSGAPGSATFVNRNPREGEEREYVTKLDDRQTGNAYGRVALVPGLSGKGKVILIAGTNSDTTVAAGDLLLREDSLREVERRLGRKVDSTLRHLEVLIETSAIGGGTKDFRIVAVR